jgi:hypothetical protein
VIEKTQKLVLDVLRSLPGQTWRCRITLPGCSVTPLQFSNLTAPAATANAGRAEIAAEETTRRTAFLNLMDFMS